jgi:hypothetical protein
MQKFDLHQAKHEAKQEANEKRTKIAVIVLFFAALVLFSYWFTQS